MLTFEGQQFAGTSDVLEKLTVSLYRERCFTSATQTFFFFQSLPFERVQHKVTTLDVQPASKSVASLLVSVTGMLIVSGLA